MGGYTQLAECDGCGTPVILMEDWCGEEPLCGECIAIGQAFDDSDVHWPNQ